MPELKEPVYIAQIEHQHKSIIKMLLYFDVFAYPLHQNELAMVIQEPNPAKENVTLELLTSDEEFAGAHIQITDVLCRIVYENQIMENPFVVNTTNFAAGTYLVNYTLPNQSSQMIKLIVSK